ncbi:barren [Panus rudis PR-1116 ss-1]|nr:barren [Panus rudis PR-1116 ss-1]
MAPPRRTGAKIAKVVEYDSGGDTEPEEVDTPKPHRTLSKKRVSDVYDASFTSDSGRAPLKSVNINDDAAEKRRRRKSAKIVPMDENAEAGPSEPRPLEREDSRTAAQMKQKQQLLSIAQQPEVNVPLDVMNSNFEEWMKMATDNKINAANSWNFALIDYFHDMSLLRNNTDNSINFQRASCTLDGCVKIWTSRVDSVGTETGKLLSNLANEGRDEEEEGDLDNPDGGEPGQGQRKRKTHRAESTLAKNISQLRNKKLDLEFTVDPLFRKTCADFDEGGAQGLLMNHLSLGVSPDGGLRVVFDASDSISKGEDEEVLEEPPDEVDLSYLRQQFIPDLDVLEGKAICHSLEGFSFSTNPFAEEPTIFNTNPTAIDDDDDDFHNEPFLDDHPNDAPMDVDDAAPPPAEEDFFVGEQAVGDDYIPDDLGAGSPDAYGDDENSAAQNGGDGPPRADGTFVPFDPRRAPNERDLVLAMTDADKDGGGMMMDYFDQSFLKNWAGPEHWKLRKVVRRPEANENAAPKPRRERKEAFKIDFLSAEERDPKDIAKALFAPVTRGTGITLPGPSYTSSSKSAKKTGRGRKGKEAEKDKSKEKRNNQTLPDDMHFSSRQLVTLFLKPQFSLRMRGHRARLDDEIDENFWAQAAAGQGPGQDGDEPDETQNGGAIPFNTQFFHDDFDDAPGFDDVYDGDGGEIASAAVDPGEQDLIAATQGQTRRVRPEYVNYAKRAKRVDVRKLKENIWKNLDIVIPEKKEDVDEDEDVDMDNGTDPSEPRTFNTVITGLQQSYPKEKLEEISTSFCFICLLHLANEQGLKLETGAEEAEEVPDEKKVGKLWDLKVYRDPNATPAS